MGWADPSRELIEAILAQDNASQAAREFSREPRDEHRIDTDNLLIALFRHWKSPAALDFYLDTLRRSADDVADEQ